MNIEKCLQLENKAKTLIPGIAQLLSKRPDQFSQGVWPTYFSKAKGCKVWDLDGNKYTDMSIGGIGATVLGYADDDVDSAVINAIKKGVASSLNCPEEVELAELLCGINPWSDMVRFARTGGEAMAIAVRIARAKTGRDKIAFCGYHGWHDWYLSANLTGENCLSEHLLSGLDPVGVPKALNGTAVPFKYNHIEDLEQILEGNEGDFAAIVMEPIRNIEPQDGFLEKVRELANKYKVVLIFDEISSGFRLCSGGAHSLYKVNPDIAVYSKAIGNGYPISAVVGKKNNMDAAQLSFISSTCWSERTGTVAALATIKKFIQEDVATHLIKIGKLVQDGWLEAAKASKLDIYVAGIPPLSHFTFSENHLVLKAYFIQEMLKRGFLASNIFYSMFSHTEKDVENYLASVEYVFCKIYKQLKKGNKIENLLLGKPAASGFKRLN